MDVILPEAIVMMLCKKFDIEKEKVSHLIHSYSTSSYSFATVYIYLEAEESMYTTEEKSNIPCEATPELLEYGKSLVCISHTHST